MIFLCFVFLICKMEVVVSDVTSQELAVLAEFLPKHLSSNGVE